MHIPISLPTIGLSGFYSVASDDMEVAVRRYAVVLELGKGKTKLISLYRYITGEWVTDIAESEVDLRNELRRQIELYESI